MTLRRDGAVPLHRQIYARLVELVETGGLPAGARLPATRALARELAVNRATVYRAYQELWAAGYLQSRPGSYTTVRARGVRRRAAAGGGARLIDWDRVATPAARRVIARHQESRRDAALRAGEDVIDFSRLAGDSTLYPVVEVRRAVREALKRQGQELLGYGDTAGFPPLRETIARRLQVHGVSVTADEIMVVNGSQQGLDVVLRLLARPGDSIALESPTYAQAIALARLHGLRVHEIPLRDDGLDVDVLARRLARERPALVYTIPNFHNPTGITSSQERREQLLALCERHRVPLVEDAFEEEMKYFGKAVLPIKSMDTRGAVIYLGTFSKVAFPGLRVGWIAADRECVARLVAVNHAVLLSGAGLMQATVDRFCRTGAYEQHLRRIHRSCRARMQLLLRRLEENLPAERVAWTRPAGGYTLWVRVPGAAEAEDALMRLLRAHGVGVAPGGRFFPGRPRELGFRLSMAGLSEAQIDEGCRRLGRALAAWRPAGRKGSRCS